MPTSPRAIYVLKSANGGLFYTPLYHAKKQEKTAELQRRLQFNENGIDYGVSSLGFFDHIIN